MVFDEFPITMRYFTQKDNSKISYKGAMNSASNVIFESLHFGIYSSRENSPHSRFQKKLLRGKPCLFSCSSLCFQLKKYTLKPFMANEQQNIQMERIF